MRLSAATAILMVVALGTSAPGQAPIAAESRYRFIDTPRVGWRARLSSESRAQIAAMGKLLAEAGEQGYEVRLLARSVGSLSVLLKGGGTMSYSYRIVAAGGDEKLLTALNEAGAEGYRLLRGGAKIYKSGPYEEQWIGVMARQGEEARFKYSSVKGADEAAERAMTEAARRGATLVAILGEEPFLLNPKPFVVFEEPPAASEPPPALTARAYRILSTVRTSTLESEIRKAATEGFRVIGAGFMAVIMTRDEKAPEPIDYRVIAMIRAATAERELQAAGAQGFRIAWVPDSTSEGVFVLQREPGQSERFAYLVRRIDEEDASDVLAAAEAEGYQVVQLFNTIVVLERIVA